MVREADEAADVTDRRLGERLRRVRAQQGRSLHEVEAASAGAIKASVLGAYERGERSLSLPRLRELADFYRVPVQELLPDDGAEPPPVEGPRMVIDLLALERRREHLPALARYVDGIRTLRGDYYGHVLTVRGDDVRALAAAGGTTPDRLRAQLEHEELVR